MSIFNSEENAKLILKEYVGNSFNGCKYFIDTNKNTFTKKIRLNSSYLSFKDIFKVIKLFNISNSKNLARV